MASSKRKFVSDKVPNHANLSRRAFSNERFTFEHYCVIILFPYRPYMSNKTGYKHSAAFGVVCAIGMAKNESTHKKCEVGSTLRSNISNFAHWFTFALNAQWNTFVIYQMPYCEKPSIRGNIVAAPTAEKESKNSKGAWKTCHFPSFFTITKYFRDLKCSPRRVIHVHGNIFRLVLAAIKRLKSSTIMPSIHTQLILRLAGTDFVLMGCNTFRV